MKEIRLIQDNELRNPAYNGQFPIPTLQEYIDGKLTLNVFEIKTTVEIKTALENKFQWQKVQTEQLEFIPN